VWGRPDGRAATVGDTNTIQASREAA